MTANGTGQRLAGKTAIITGGARGQGATHARVLAKHGARIVIGDILDAEGAATASRLRDSGLDVSFRHLDVTSPEDWDATVAFAEERFGRLDILVNNAAIFPGANLLDCSAKEWASVIAVNQTGPFLGMQRAVPTMRKNGGGSIINICSVAGTLGTEIAIAYAVSKAAILMLTRAAAVTLAPDVRVNCVTPGIVDDTEMARALPPDRLRERLATYPMGRAARQEEISAAVVFLASDESSFTTGGELRVDGGALAGVRQRKP
jgi:3alpha(or 20beta)-hydroxysteroid dehydrogenase